MSKKRYNKQEIEKIETNPAVSLIVVNEFGTVVLVEILGGEELVKILNLASERSAEDNYPIEKNDSLLDCVGQDMYSCNDLEYIKSIRGCFFYLSRERSDELVRICDREGLKFSFVVSY